MPKTTTKKNTWISELRSQIKREHGVGWKVQEQSEKARIFHTLEDGSRPSVTTDIEWKAGQATVILNMVAVLKSTMDEQDISIKAAYARTQQVEGTITAKGVKAGAIEWQSIANDFMASKEDRRSTTLRDTGGRIKKAVALFGMKPKPTDGASLMRTYAKKYFDNCPAGGEGRIRGLGDVAAFLAFAIKNRGVPARFAPLEGDDREALIGTSDDAEDSLTPPIKPEQLEALLDALEADKRPELRLAVALVGCFGLRPAELAALSVEDGKLYVGSQVKRNKRSMSKPIKKRRVIALELDGREDGAQALQLYASGLVKLPLALRNRIEKVKTEGGSFKPVGDEFRQQLADRYPFWQSMVAATPGLTPYSLRHGWAWRAHKYFATPLSVRDAAALMGHTPATHHKHYGRWTDEQGLEDAIGRLTSMAKTEKMAPVKTGECS